MKGQGPGGTCQGCIGHQWLVNTTYEQSHCSKISSPVTLSLLGRLRLYPQQTPSDRDRMAADLAQLVEVSSPSPASPSAGAEATASDPAPG